MGTNYYARKYDHDTCTVSSLHIGKSSGGWNFSLHVISQRDSDFDNAGRPLLCLEDWLPVFDTHRIFDEYDREITKEEMLDIIANRHGVFGEILTLEEARRAGGEVGINNLIAHKVDNSFCYGTEGGTWDLIAGEFC